VNARVVDFDPDGIRPFFFTPWTTFKTWIWFLAVAASLLVFVAVSLATSGLSIEVLANVLLSDLRHVLGVPPTGPRIEAGLGWPAWRDVVSMVVLLAMAWTPLNAALQADGYRDLLSHMKARGALVIKEASELDAVNTLVEKANRQIRSASFARVPILVICLGVCVFLYSRLAEAYAADGGEWWVSSASVVTPVYIFVCAFGLYTATIQNICAFIVVQTVERIEPLVMVGVDLANTDRRWGWKPAGVVLGAAYRAITVHLFALIVVSLAIPHIDPLWWLNIAVLIISMGTAPFWIVLPLLLTTRLVKAFRTRELANLYDEHRGSGKYSLTTAARADRLNSVPSVPFLRFWNVFAAVALQLINLPALVSLIAAVVAVVMGTTPPSS
jgi:hypothetical protein